MHDELRDVRDALTHWDEWGAERSKAQRRLLSNHPDDWPFQLEISGGEILLGASLKLSEVGEAALRLYEWTRDPSSPTGLYVKPDPHTHQLVARFRKQSFFRVAHALKRKGFKCAGANDYLVILLRRPDAAGAAMDVVLAADGGATFGPVERIPDDDGDEAEDNEIDDDAGRND